MEPQRFLINPVLKMTIKIKTTEEGSTDRREGKVNKVIIASAALATPTNDNINNCKSRNRILTYTCTVQAL